MLLYESYSCQHHGSWVKLTHLMKLNHRGLFLGSVRLKWYISINPVYIQSKKKLIFIVLHTSVSGGKTSRIIRNKGESQTFHQNKYTFLYVRSHARLNPIFSSVADNQSIGTVVSPHSYAT